MRLIVAPSYGENYKELLFDSKGFKTKVSLAMIFSNGICYSYGTANFSYAQSRGYILYL